MKSGVRPVQRILCAAVPLPEGSRSGLDPFWTPRYGPAAFQPLSLAKPKHSGFQERRLGRSGGKPSRVPDRASGLGGSMRAASSSRTGKGGQGGQGMDSGMGGHGGGFRVGAGGSRSANAGTAGGRQPGRHNVEPAGARAPGLPHRHGMLPQGRLRTRCVVPPAGPGRPGQPDRRRKAKSEPVGFSE